MNNFWIIFQTVVLESNNFMIWRHIKDNILGPFIKLANILVFL